MFLLRRFEVDFFYKNDTSWIFPDKKLRIFLLLLFKEDLDVIYHVTSDWEL